MQLALRETYNSSSDGAIYSTISFDTEVSYDPILDQCGKLFTEESLHEMVEQLSHLKELREEHKDETVEEEAKAELPCSFGLSHCLD